MAIGSWIPATNVVALTAAGSWAAVTEVVSDPDGGGGAAPPTTGQLWPRGNP